MNTDRTHLVGARGWVCGVEAGAGWMKQKGGHRLASLENVTLGSRVL